jgi:hypothetical protein
MALEPKKFIPFPDRRIGPWFWGASGRWIHAEKVWKNEPKQPEKPDTNGE